LLKHSYLSLYFVCQLYYWSYSLKQRFLCAILFQQSHITKHTSVSSPWKTLITTTLSTKCLSYALFQNHLTCVCQCGDQFIVHFNLCCDHHCTTYKTKLLLAHWFFSIDPLRVPFVLLWESGEYGGIFFVYSYIPMFFWSLDVGM